MNNCRLGTIEQIGVLNTDVLMTAPKGYFDSVQRVAKKLTEKIQGDLSNSDKSTLNSKIKRGSYRHNIKRGCLSSYQHKSI